MLLNMWSLNTNKKHIKYMLNNNSKNGCKVFTMLMLVCVVTLALGLWPKQGLAKVRAKYEARESHFMFLGVQKSVREWTLTFPSELPLWELESRWSLESSKSNYRGQNSLDWGVPYIIEKLLELICLNELAWPIWTLSTQVIAKRKAGSQIDNLISDH
jgi:hypothetical protein